MPGANLVYIYRQQGRTGEPDLDQLTPENLLVPPLFINRLPWSRGYFETVTTHSLTTEQLLPQHCFRRSNGTYLDENGQPLNAELHPCGDWGLHSFRSVDDLISDALGVPRVPE